MDIPSLNKEDLKKALEENRQYLKAIYRQLEKTRRYILWGRVISFLYLLLLVAPLVLALIYLPPLLREVVEPYQELLGETSGKREVNEDLLNQVQGFLQER